MRNRSVVFVILGLTACLCWAIGTAVADNQPGTKVTQTGTDGVAQPQSAKPMSGATAIPAGNAEMSFQKVSAALPAPRGDASGRSIKPLLPIDVSDLPPGTPGEPQPRTNCAAGTTVGVTGVNWPAVPPTGNMVFCSDMVGGYWTGAGASMAGNEWVFDDI